MFCRLQWQKGMLSTTSMVSVSNVGDCGLWMFRSGCPWVLNFTTENPDFLVNDSVPYRATD